MRTPHRPAVLRDRVFRGRDVVADGVLTPGALRSTAWRRLYRGVYADSSLPDGVGLRIRGASLIAPPTAVFSGCTAAWLHGATDLASVHDPVEVTVPPGVSFGPVTGLRIRHAALPPHALTTAHGRRCTTGLATALQIAATDDVLDAVAALDILVARDIVDERELRDAAEASSGRGSRRAQRAVRLVDRRAESRPESKVRAVLTLAGIAVVPQFVVRNGSGGFVARVDLAVPHLRMAIEYDGAWHGDPRQLPRDRRRLNHLTAAGWRVLFLTAEDLRDRRALAAKVRAFLATATSGKVLL